MRTPHLLRWQGGKAEKGGHPLACLRLLLTDACALSFVSLLGQLFLFGLYIGTWIHVETKYQAAKKKEITKVSE